MGDLRLDGRNPNQLRPLVCSRGLLHRADGSARWSQENTIVVAAVYGPKAVSGRKENPERAILEVIWKPKTGIAGTPEKEAEFVMKQTLEHIVLTGLHPNTAISVIIQFEENNVLNFDKLVACAINAACVALIDAGVPLSGLVVSVSCTVNNQGNVLLDPVKREEKELQGHVCFAFPCRSLSVKSIEVTKIDNEPLENGIISSITKGPFSADDYLNCLERSRAASLKISEFVRLSLERTQRGVEMLVSS